LKHKLIQPWQSITVKFEALNKRERLMVTCAIFAAAFFILNTLLLSPTLTRQQRISKELAIDNAQIETMRQELELLSRTPVIDPDAQNRQRISALQSQLKLLERDLNGLQSTLISPEEMPELLRSLLKKNGALKLIALKTLPATSLIENESTNLTGKDAVINVADNKNPPVFKHGVEITIEGRYLDLLEYISDLEKMPWHVLWSKVNLNAEDYPDTQLILTVYTLSLDKNWLSI
jgi:MSHA biogenesis protein MshJ